MFTIDQIATAHNKVKTGADFPPYVRDLIALGVEKYETFVRDGHTEYFGSDNFKVKSPSKYADLAVAEKSNAQKFQNCLKNHQQGHTNYMTFCNDAAKSGVEKWVTDTKAMTCTYYDQVGTVMLSEKIPQV